MIWMSRDAKGRLFLHYSGPDGAFLRYLFKVLPTCFLDINRGVLAGSSIGFIRALAGLEGLAITDWKLKGIEPVAELHQLRLLRLSTPLVRQPLDLGSFPLLLELGIDFAETVSRVDECTTLKEVFLGRFKSPSMESLNHLQQLIRADFSEPSFEAIGNVDLPELQYLTIRACQSLTDWSGIAKLRSLKAIILRSTTQLCSLEPFVELSGLERLILEDCGRIESLEPLAKLQKLTTLIIVGNTRIMDGNMSVLLNAPRIKDVRFPNRSNYDITASQLMRTLHARA